MAFRFLHAADLHLDTPFTGLGATSPAVGTLLRDASLLALDELVRVAIARDVSFVVLAGDVYDGAERGVRAQLRMLRSTQRLAEHGIPTFVAHGNHDPVEEGWTAVHEWPELVTVFPPDDALSVPVERDGRHLATVHGISYRRRHETEDLAARIDVAGTEGPHIAVLHANVGGQPGHDPYSPCTVDQLVASRVDYWALGHVHTRQVLHRDPWVVYPGNIQGRHRREPGARGALVVEVDDAGRFLEPEFVPLDRVRLEEAEVDIGTLGDIGTLRDRLREVGHRLLTDADGRSIVLRVALVGRGPLHADIARPGVLDEVVAELRHEERDRPPLLWWEALDDRTRGAHELAELSQRSDFVADLVDEADEILASRLGELDDAWRDELPSDLPLLLGDASAGGSSSTLESRWRAALELAVDLVDRHGD